MVERRQIHRERQPHVGTQVLYLTVALPEVDAGKHQRAPGGHTHVLRAAELHEGPDAPEGPGYSRCPRKRGAERLIRS